MILVFEFGTELIKVKIKKKKVYIATAGTNYNYFEFSKFNIRSIKRNSIKHKDLLFEERDDWKAIENAKTDEEIKEVIIKELSKQGFILVTEVNKEDG